jgi:hypothetical protein
MYEYAYAGIADYGVYVSELKYEQHTCAQLAAELGSLVKIKSVFL